MNQNGTGHNNLLDTTDCLEAVGVFKGWKNILFIVVFICLLLTQACFWVVDVGLLSLPSESSNTVATGNSISPSVPAEPNMPIAQIAQIAQPNEPADANTLTSQTPVNFVVKIISDRLVWVLKLVDALLILAATLYMLTMLFALKISLVGRLGGINHITRAFLLSLFMLILLLPWQKVFGDIVVGAVFTAGAITNAASLKTGGIFEKTLYYMRFSGYSVLILLLLVLAQIRSSRWAGAILRRLEII